MIIVDTSVWVDHLRHGDPAMHRLLGGGQVAMHPFVLGEIALGYLNPRDVVLGTLRTLPAAEIADNDEVLEFIEKYRIVGTGLGYVDVHVLIAAALSFCWIWTRDRNLRRMAQELGIAANWLN